MSLNQSVSGDGVRRRSYILLRPGAAKVLSVVALGCLHLWLVLSFVLSKEFSWGNLIASCVSLVGMLAAVIMFLCTYSYVANAPDCHDSLRVIIASGRLSRFESSIHF